MHPEESSCHEDDNCKAFKHWYDWILAPAAPFIMVYYWWTGRL